VTRANRRKNILRALWLVAVMMVVVGSLLPADSASIEALDRLGISDKIEHFLAYFVLVLLPAIHERRRFVAGCALGAVALGIALEFVQLYSPGRTFEIADMLADAAGVVCGLIVSIPLRASRIRNFLGVQPAAD
jgi:VanZ family protein